jgi:DNA-binding NarL/FixJ family response regulator
MAAEGAWDMPSLLAAVNAGQPDIVLIQSGTQDAATLLAVSLGLGRATKVVVFDLSVGREAEIIAAAEAGVAGLHLDSESFADLLAVLQAVSQGHAQCSPEVSAILLRRVYAFAGESNPDAQTDMLSPREVDILELIAVGLTNQQIASRLALSLPTVKNHVHRVLTKMGVASRAEAVTVYQANQYGNPAQGQL